MKTKIFLLLCMFLCFGLNQLHAQIPLPPAPENKTGNGAVPFEYTWTEYWQPISCDGFNDELVGTVSVHWVVHFKNGLPITANEHMFGTVVSTKTPEVFKLHENDKLEYFELEGESNYSYVHWHFNLLGNLGSHYVGAMTYNYKTGEMWTDKLICVGKK